MSAPADAAVDRLTLERYRDAVRELSGTSTLPLGVDEVVTDSATRPGQELIAETIASLGMPGLLSARAEIRRLVADDGIRYGATADGSPGRNWVIDPLPVILPYAEWASMEAALRQRSTLLNLVLRDIYGERSLIRRGILPAEAVLAHPLFIHQVDGITMPGDHPLLIASSDLGRAADGTWTVLSDRTSVPSGAGYAMANRRITSRTMGGLHRATRLMRLRAFFHTLAAALLSVAPDAQGAVKGVLLSPGSVSETAYEHGFLATLLGFPLVEPEDLTMRDGQVWVGPHDRLDRVDVILRRIDAHYLDPLELRSDSQLGIPGLIEACRRRQVTVANPIGAGVLENPALLAYLPQICRELLGEELLLPSAQTWWCGDRASREHVLANLDTLVIKPIGRSEEVTSIRGDLLTADERDELRARIETAPWEWVGQHAVELSTAPVVTQNGLTPRRLVIRSFGVALGGEYHFLPGGLGRVGHDTNAAVVSNMAGALAKDIWVLAPDDETAAATRSLRPEAYLPRMVPRTIGVSPRVAENLYWFGRYAERTEDTARLLRVADDLTEDYANRPGSTGAAVAQAMVQAVGAITNVPLVTQADAGDAVDAEAAVDAGDAVDGMASLRRAYTDAAVPGSLAYAVRRMVSAADEIRDQLSHDTWHVLARLERTVETPPPLDSQLQPSLYDVLESTLALDGIFAESLVRDATWAYLDAGTRIERAQFLLSLLGTVVAERPPALDGQITEAVIEIGESIITHRRRTAAGEGPAWPIHSAMSLLLLDENNPRSVAFQLNRLREDVAVIDDPELVERIDGVRATVERFDAEDVVDGPRGDVGVLLGQVAREVRAISSDLTDRHFRRAAPLQSMPTSWAKGGILND